ncbi:hypothetical protein AB3N59_06885 [Leptospira sp. WS92.C1]
MKTIRNFLSAGTLAAVLLISLFLGSCKKEEKDNAGLNTILLLLAIQPRVEQSRTGFFIIVPKGIAE